MRIIFVRFEQTTGVRRFVFDCISDEKQPTTRRLVSADLALARKHGISLQALPLLCRQLLETLSLSPVDAQVSLTEECMLKISAAALAESSIRSKRSRSQAPEPT